jgi:signal transduction histidine kinase
MDVLNRLLSWFDTEYDQPLPQNRQLLNQATLLVLLIMALCTAVFIAPLVEESLLTLVAASVAALVVLTAIGLLRSNRPRSADSLVFFGIFTIVAVVNLVDRGNIAMEPSLFMFTIAIAGLLYRPKTIVWVTAISTLVLTTKFLVHLPSFLESGLLARNLAAAFGYVMLFVITASFQVTLKRVLLNAWLDVLASNEQVQHKNTQLEREISERNCAEETARARSAELGALFDVANSISSTLDLQALLPEIARRLDTLVRCDTILIAELNTTGKLKAIHVEGDANYVSRMSAESLEIDSEDPDLFNRDNPTRPVIITDIDANTPEANIKRERLLAIFGRVPCYAQSSIAAPLITNGSVTGLLLLQSSERGCFSQDVAPFISAIAGMISASIQKSRLHVHALQSAALAERGRIARELHDSVSQSLFGIVLGLRTMDATEKPSREAYTYVFQLAEAALNDTRALVFELRPEYLEREGLIAALKKQASTVCARHNINVLTELGSVEPALDLRQKESLYRLAMEAVQNAVKHARADLIQIRMNVGEGTLGLTIADNGSGFDTTREYEGHFGLRTMQERALALRARCSVDSALGHGTLVRVSLEFNVPARATQARRAVA